MSAFIKLSRSIEDWEWYSDPNVLALWVHILLDAKRFAGTWRGDLYEVGTFPTSIQKLSLESGLTLQQTRTCLKKLQSTNEITIKSTNKGTKIIVNKYGFYQGSDDDSNKQNNKPFNKQNNTQGNTQSNTQGNTQDNNTIRKIKKEKKEKNIYIYYGEFKNVALTDEQLAKLKQEFPTDWEDRIERVSEYCASTGKSYKDYLATIRSWARKDSGHTKQREDRLPVYDTSKNPKMSKEEMDEILKLMNERNDL